MKLIKPLCLAALVAGGLFACNIALLAQDSTNTPPAGPRPGGTMRGRMTIDRIAAQLKLTDDQKAKVAPIIEAQNKKMADLRNDPDFSSLSREDKMAKMKAIHDDTTAQLKPILTDDQFAQWQKMARMRRSRCPLQRRHQRPGLHSAAKLTDLWGHIVDTGTASSRPFLFWRRRFAGGLQIKFNGAESIESRTDSN